MVDQAQSETATSDVIDDRSQQLLGFWKRVRRYFTTLAILGGLGVLFLPWIASKLLCEQTAEAWISEQISGSIQIGGASIGWQSPVLLNDVSYKNAQGKQLVNVKAVTSNQSLWDLLRRPKRPIELELEGMQASFVVPQLEPHEPSEQSIDLNLVLQQLLKHQIPKVNRQMTVRVIQSELKLLDAAGNVLSRWSPIEGEYQSKTGSQPEQTITIDAPVAAISQNAPENSAAEQKLHFDAQWLGVKGANGPERLTMNLDLAKQPATALQPLLEATLPELFPIEPLTGTFAGLIERVGQEDLRLQLATLNSNPRSEPATNLPFNLALDASYSKAKDRIDISQVYAQLDETAIDVQGTVSQVSGEQVVDARGTFQSPAEGLSKLLPEELKKNVEFKDIALSDLSIKGPLRPDPKQPFNFVFELSTTVSWTEATAYGLKSIAGKVKLTMLGNQLMLTPIDLPVSGGNIRQLPQLDLATQPISVSIPQGVMLDRIALTEDICADWLRFLSPLLADATRPSGTFSLDSDAGKFQLEHMSEANLSGRIQIHQGQVRPGPLADEILGMVSALKAVQPKAGGATDDFLFLKMPNQIVEYRVVEGRVYHAGFNFKVGDFTFTSNGSVGLDETLDLVVSMQFPEALANRGPLLQALQNETLDFKITGTMDHPKIQGDQLKDVGKRIGIKAAEGLLERILEKRQSRKPRGR